MCACVTCADVGLKPRLEALPCAKLAMTLVVVRAGVEGQRLRRCYGASMEMVAGVLFGCRGVARLAEMEGRVGEGILRWGLL